MKNKFFMLGILAIALVFGMMVVGCDPNKDDDGAITLTGKGGTITVTDIPAKYNGKYAYFTEVFMDGSGHDPSLPPEPLMGNIRASNSEPETALIGAQSINMSTFTATLVQISNRQVSIPMGIVNLSTYSVTGYSGNDTVMGVVAIYNTPTVEIESEPFAMIDFESITFTNGSVAISAEAGEIYED